MSAFFGSSLTGFLSLAVLMVAALPNAAQAKFFFWEDANFKVSLEVPDTWRRVHNQKPDDIWTFMGEGQDDFAKCRMRVNEDRRFMIYPQRFAQPVRNLNWGEEFWLDYIAQYPQSKIEKMRPKSGGVGRALGSHSYITFTSDMAPAGARKSLALAGLYRDKAYVFECSSTVESFDEWTPIFNKIGQSVQMRQENFSPPTGHYTRKLYDFPLIKIMNGADEIDAVYY